MLDSHSYPPGEAGLLLTQVLRHQPFLGYRGPREHTERKLVKNVRRPNDLYYNTGDVLALDDEGFLYFRDRLGDTFRSRGVSQGGASGFWRGRSFVDRRRSVSFPGARLVDAGGGRACGRRRGLSFPGAGLLNSRGDGA